MLDTIKKELERQQVKDYILTEEQEESAEYFFIKKQLDSYRKKKVTHYHVDLYREFTDGEGQRQEGISSVCIHPGMEEDEVAEKIAEGLRAALCAGNPLFELPEPVRAEPVVMPSSLSQVSLKEAAEKLSAALYEAAQDETAFINSAEIFVVKTTRHILTSRGTDVAYTRYNTNGEFVVQCVAPQDVEFHQTFSYDDLNTEGIRGKAEEALQMVRDRAQAVNAPAGGIYDLILSGDEVERLLSYYKIRANASMVYPGYSDYKTGMHVQGEAIGGEKLNITLKAVAPYSYDGIPMKDRELIRDGELKLIHGTTRFCYYLGIEPTGVYTALRVDNGTLPFEQMKQSSCIHVTKFSDFQMDSSTGYFNGEIRLAYLYEDGKVSCVTGGSISGFLPEAQKEMVFSVERYESSRYEGPYAVKLRGISVAGA